MKSNFYWVFQAALAAAFVLGGAEAVLAQVSMGGDPSRTMDTSFYERLLPLHRAKKSPGPNDWLARHDEPGQTFEEYIQGQPVVPDAGHRIIYLALLGDFDPSRKEIVEQTARFMAVYFQMPVKFIAPIPDTVIPDSARRRHPQTGDRQVLTSYINEQLLKPGRPDDAFCLIAFTASDLWPGEGWNFVFGEAWPEQRVGVWSIYRNGDPAQGPEQARLCLKRTIKTGTHEIGHLFSLYHCIYFECAMNGSNYRKEADDRPLDLCPVCLRKLAWAVRFDPVKRYQELRQMAEEMGFRDEAQFYRRSEEVLRLNTPR